MKKGMKCSFGVVLLFAMILGSGVFAASQPQRARRAGGIHGMLNDEGRAVMEAHRQEQREQMQVQMQKNREAQQALRRAMKEENDPHKQLDLLEAHIKGRQEERLRRFEEGQQARVSAYSAALAASGVDDEAREQALGRIQQRQQRQVRPAAQRDGSAALAKIEALRAQEDLTRKDVHALIVEATGPGRRRDHRIGPADGRRERPRGRQKEDHQESPVEE